MARINIEDSLFKDNRFFELLQKLGSTDAALGAIVRAWIVAQEYWTLNGIGIPVPVWKKQKLRPELIEVGLAEERGDFIYIAGSDEQFAWLAQKVDAGRKGGLKAGKNKKHDMEESIQRNGARSILGRAVAQGKIDKPDKCEKCGAEGEVIEGHHSDYSKPLDVDWVCKGCHTVIHRALRNDWTLPEAPLKRGLAQRTLLPLSPSPSQKEKEKEEKINISPCLDAWEKTLTRFNIAKDPRLDEPTIYRLVMIHGAEKTTLALLGYGFQESFDGYDPKKYCRITHLLKPDKFELCVNLGAQQIIKPTWGIASDAIQLDK